MLVIPGRNVCEILPVGLDALAHDGVREETRAGPAIVMPYPVVSVYERPTERVLRSARRDANPFFHLYESLWMLAGRDETTSLDRYVKDFGKRFAEKDGSMHGAYGKRWRGAIGGIDQLSEVVDKLRKNPQDRQAVIQMWDCREFVEEDGSVNVQLGCDDLRGDWKDRPCNTHVYLRVRQEQAPHVEGAPFFSSLRGPVLDLTVCCRSNDAVMGAHGANAVHFSVLQEYLAGRIGVGVGKLYQISNNYHAYVRDLDKVGDPRLLLDERDPYLSGDFSVLPIGTNFHAWDSDLGTFMRWHDLLWQNGPSEFVGEYVNDWFLDVPTWAALANWHYRGGDINSAVIAADNIAAGDWCLACCEWLHRRIK